MIKIHKYGGTILNKTQCYQKILENIEKEIAIGNQVIIIVSAIGRNTDPYATDTFLSQTKNLNNKERDRLITIGETISSLYLLNYLREQKVNAYALDYDELGIMITQDGIKLSAENYKSLLVKYPVLIVPGFQGMDENHKIVAMPRGGSDLSAILIARAVGVKEVSLYKDVKGVMSGDPTLVASPSLIKYISYDEMILIAAHGGQIIQKEAIELASKYNVKIKVTDFRTNKVGTIISSRGLMNNYYCLTIDNTKINLLGRNMNTTKNEIIDLLSAFHIKLTSYLQTENIITIKVEDGKRNFAINLLHHKFIC